MIWVVVARLYQLVKQVLTIGKWIVKKTDSTNVVIFHSRFTGRYLVKQYDPFTRVMHIYRKIVLIGVGLIWLICRSTHLNPSSVRILHFSWLWHGSSQAGTIVWHCSTPPWPPTPSPLPPPSSGPLSLSARPQRWGAWYWRNNLLLSSSHTCCWPQPPFLPRQCTRDRPLRETTGRYGDARPSSSPYDSLSE